MSTVSTDESERLECSESDHWEYCYQRSLDTNLLKYMLAVKFSMSLTCWIHDSNLIHY